MRIISGYTSKTFPEAQEMDTVTRTKFGNKKMAPLKWVKNQMAPLA